MPADKRIRISKETLKALRIYKAQEELRTDDEAVQHLLETLGYTQEAVQHSSAWERMFDEYEGTMHKHSETDNWY